MIDQHGRDGDTYRFDAVAVVFASGTVILRPLAKALAGRIAGRTAALRRTAAASSVRSVGR